MARRRNRKSIVYRPKGKGNRKGKAKAKGDQEEIVPSGWAWNKMHLFGAFSIGDKSDDHQKYRFRRNDIATILPSHVAPGDPIEPHEYWVGKILEIRADQGCMNSEQICTKVQWLYSAEETKDLIPSLDVSMFGKYERIWSDHWDFVYPHAFNEVITLPRLLTFPRTSPASILQQTLPRTPKQRGQHQRSREPSLLSSSSTPTTITTGTIDSGSSTTTLTTVASTSNASADAPTPRNLMAQRIIGPGMFYWRYTLSVEERILGPEPTSQSNCICSNPYRPDDDSLRNGVMIYCPRQGCRTGYHLGCLEDLNCVWVDSDDDVRKNGGRMNGRKSVRGNGKKRANVNEALDEDDDDDEEEEKWLSKRAIRQISTSPGSKDAYIDLLSLLTTSPKKMKKDGDLVISLLERVYDLQLERHYRYSQSKSNFSLPPRQKGKTKSLTSNSLLAALFILPPPFPLVPSPFLSKQQKRQCRQQCELHLLLALACQPLFRGGGCFGDLGPTGNVNAVLCAREFVWEVVSRIGELDLSNDLLKGGRGEGEGRRGVSSSEVEDSEQERDEQGEERERRDRENFTRIRECVESVLDGYRRKFFSLSTTDNDDNSGNEGDNGKCSDSNDGGSTGLMKDSVLPPDGVIEDAIVVKQGLLFFDYLHRSKKRISSSSRICVDSTLTSDVDGDGGVDTDAGDDTDRDVDVEGDIDRGGGLVGGLWVKDEPVSDGEIVEETEQEEEEEVEDLRDDDDTNTSADEIDDMLLAGHRKRKRLTATMTGSCYYQMRKKHRAGIAVSEEGDRSGCVSDSGDEETDEDEEEDEEEEEDIEDTMLLNADWACPGCRGSI